MERLTDGRLPAYSSIGCYPLIYLTTSGDVLCADCANEDSDRDTLTQDVHEEGPPLDCDGCGKDIESAYGDPHSPKD